MKIKIKYHNENCKIKFIKKGEWIDLKSAIKVDLEPPKYNKNTKSYDFQYMLIPLGISMKLPKGFEAIMVPRSSTYKRWNVIQSNNVGVIDSSYSGTNDIWKFPILSFGCKTIEESDKICQFRIQPSQKASVWIKLKWLFTNKIEFVEVDKLEDIDRGGFGTTGKK